MPHVHSQTAITVYQVPPHAVSIQTRQAPGWLTQDHGEINRPHRRDAAGARYKNKTF
jgi:hypothetical protein